MTEEEKQWLTRIVQKSELAKSYMSQRGKENNKYAFGEKDVAHQIQICEANMVEIREIQKQDYKKAQKFAIQGMHLNWYMDNETILSLYSKYFWHMG